ncbi:hypothetical protein FRC08_000129 [Ceratobasidium sp. 394]|nr:hypothetical protein FRC08_000129 [Ceratobasidium sp. 394]KAG9087515.1 hypothetical protein FS749_002860 [Ceratobasidium sp. UAMH 11750]
MEVRRDVQPGITREYPDAEDTLLKEERTVAPLPGTRLLRVLTSFSITVNGDLAELNPADVKSGNWENIEFRGVIGTLVGRSGLFAQCGWFGNYDLDWCWVRLPRISALCFRGDARFRGGSLCAWIQTPIADYALMLPHRDYVDKWESTLNALGPETARAKCWMWPVGGTRPEWWGDAWKDDWPFKPRSVLKRRASAEISREEGAPRRAVVAPEQSANQTPGPEGQCGADNTGKAPTYFVRFGPWKLQRDGGSKPSPSTAPHERGNGRGRGKWKA